jgi:hypothetical protein
MNPTVAADAAPDRKKLDLIKDVRFRPVFIVGDHRSGTTLLHRLLAETGCFNYVSAYHVIRYEEVLSDFLAGRTEVAHREVMAEFARQGIKDRVIDATPAVPEAPIEYGFILSTASNQRPRITEKTLDKFDELARKIQYVSHPDKPLLLKNPWDVICFMDIKRWYPEARFVFIHRHPVNILNSQLRAIRSMLSSRNGFTAMIAPWYRALYERPLRLWFSRAIAKPPLRIWERLLAHHTAKMANYYMTNFKLLPPSDAVEIQYEELCRQPDATMKRVLDFLDAHPAGEIRWTDRIAPREPRLLPEVIELFHSIRGKLRPYLALNKYTLDPK